MYQLFLMLVAVRSLSSDERYATFDVFPLSGLSCCIQLYLKQYIFFFTLRLIENGIPNKNDVTR